MLDTYGNPVDFEAFAGAAPIDVLHERRRTLHDEYADLYAFNQVWKDKRKAFLSVRAVQLRDAARERGEKITDKAVEEQSHADAEYLEWLDAATTKLARWAVVESEIAMLDQLANRGQAVLKLAANAPRE